MRKTKTLVKISSFALTLYFLASNSALAQTITATSSGVSSANNQPIFQIPNLFGFSNLGSITNVLISLAFFVAGLAFFINLVIGGIQWISAGGDVKAMAAARSRITNAVIGLIIVVAAFAITAIVGAVLGISIVGGFKFKTP